MLWCDNKCFNLIKWGSCSLGSGIITFFSFFLCFFLFLFSFLEHSFFLLGFRKRRNGPNFKTQNIFATSKKVCEWNCNLWFCLYRNCSCSWSWWCYWGFWVSFLIFFRFLSFKKKQNIQFFLGDQVHSEFLGTT